MSFFQAKTAFDFSTLELNGCLVFPCTVLVWRMVGFFIGKELTLDEIILLLLNLAPPLFVPDLGSAVFHSDQPFHPIRHGFQSAADADSLVLPEYALNVRREVRIGRRLVRRSLEPPERGKGWSIFELLPE